MPINIQNELPVIKDSIVKQFRATNSLNNIDLDKVINAKDYKAIKSELESIAIDISLKTEENDKQFLSNFIYKYNKNGLIPLAIAQLFNSYTIQKNKLLSNFFKILTIKDTDPKVLKIKKKLTKDYGINEVYLNNHLENAKKLLDAAKFLKENNIPMPEEIIFSDFAIGAYVSQYCVTLPKENGKNTVVFNSRLVEDNDDAWTRSTDSPLHVIVHECIHCIQPTLISFNMKKIPKKFHDIINKISPYASDNYAHEIHAELLTKKILNKLSPEEEELLQYLGGTWLA